VNVGGPAAAGRPLRWAVVVAALAAALTVLIALLGAGCSGSNDEKQRPAGPLADALSHLPAESGAALVVETDPRRGPLASVRRLARRSRAWSRVERGLGASLARAGLDVRRLPAGELGNPFVLASGDTQQPVGAMRLREPGTMRAAVERRVAAGRARRLPGHAGVSGWVEDGTFAAIDGADLVVARTRADLERAIDTANGTDSLAYDLRFVRGLQPRAGTLVRAFGDAQRLLGGVAQAQDLRRIGWVRSLGDFRGTARLRHRTLLLDFRLVTNRAAVSDEELPLSPGQKAPRLHDTSAPASLALLAPDRLATFVERSVAVTNPDAYSTYSDDVSQLRSLFDFDFHRDLLEKITNLSIALSSPTSLTFVARLERASAARIAAKLRRIEPALQFGIGDLLPGTSLGASGRGMSRQWTIKRGRLVVARYAVRGGSLVGAIGAGRLPPPALGRKLPETSGSLTLEGDIGRIGRLLGTLLAFPRETLDLVSGLGNLRLGVRAERSGLTASGRVEVGRAR
jgi:hypothetical protein